jgi:hypothetical protein
VSVGMDFFSNPRVQKFKMRLELSYSSISPVLTGIQYTNTNGAFAKTYSFTQNTISIAPQWIWNVYNAEDFKFYLSAGITFNFSSYPKNNLGFVGVINTTDPPYKLASSWSSIPLQAGVVIKKHIEIFASYSTSATLYSSEQSVLNTKATNVGLRYLFGKY